MSGFLWKLLSGSVFNRDNSILPKVSGLALRPPTLTNKHRFLWMLWVAGDERYQSYLAAKRHSRGNEKRKT